MKRLKFAPFRSQTSESEVSTPDGFWDNIVYTMNTNSNSDHSEGKENINIPQTGFSGTGERNEGAVGGVPTTHNVGTNQTFTTHNTGTNQTFPTHNMGANQTPPPTTILQTRDLASIINDNNRDNFARAQGLNYYCRGKYC